MCITPRISMVILGAGIMVGLPLHAGPAHRGTGPAAGSEPGFTLALSAVQATVQAGSPVTAKVVTANLSDQEIYFMVDRGTDMAIAYTVDIAAENGDAPADTLLRRRFRSGIAVSEHEYGDEDRGEHGFSECKARRAPKRHN